jgi:hypothetical protein
MGTVNLPKSGKSARRQTRGAYLPKTGENRQDSLDRIFKEQAARLSGRLGAKLPAEALQRLDEKLYGFISQNYSFISGSFLWSHGEELTRGDSGAIKNTAIKMMLESEVGRFNSGEIEKSLGSRQWGISDLEAHTDNMLRCKSGIGSIVDSQKTNSVLICVFKDNAKKPKTVTDLKLSVNILETELIDSESMYKAEAAYLTREIICKHLFESIDNAEILKTAAKEEAVKFVDGLLNRRLEIDSPDLDEYLGNIDSSDEIEEVRSRGFSAASNLIVSILNAVNLDCQFLENHKDKREVILREYEDTDDTVLPDERYQIRLRYLSKARLLEERAAYNGRIKNLSVETLRLWDLLEVIYQDSKSVFKVNDFEDLVRKNKNRINDPLKDGTGKSPYDLQKPFETHPDPVHGEKEEIRVLLAKMEERIKNITDSMYPVEKQITEERLSLLEKEFSCFENCINPYSLQPGILVDIDLTTIKRKRTTLDSMSAALGLFLDDVSGCFRDVI